jgi:restriction system protein
MPIPDYQTLMLPLLKRAENKGVRVPEIERSVADEFGLTEKERNQYLRSGRQKVLHNRLHWAKFYMSKAGLLTSLGQGRFAANEKGRELLTRGLARIDNSVLMEFPSFREFQNAETDDETAVTTPSSPSSVITPEEQVESAYVTLLSALRADLLQRILQNSPTFFEQVIVDLLVGMGYGGSHKNAATQLGRSGDGGVDGVINEDRLGLDRVYVQAKRYKDGTVGRPEVQAFVGSLVGLGATKGVFVTTSTFSQGAIEFAKNLTQRVILIDGERLTDLMIEHDIGVRVSRAIQFKRIDEDFFAEEE